MPRAHTVSSSVTGITGSRLSACDHREVLHHNRLYALESRQYLRPKNPPQVKQHRKRRGASGRNSGDGDVKSEVRLVASRGWGLVHAFPTRSSSPYAHAARQVPGSTSALRKRSSSFFVTAALVLAVPRPPTLASNSLRRVEPFRRLIKNQPSRLPSLPLQTKMRMTVGRNHSFSDTQF